MLVFAQLSFHDYAAIISQPSNLIFLTPTRVSVFTVTTVISLSYPKIFLVHALYYC